MSEGIASNPWIVNEGQTTRAPVKLGTFVDVEHRNGEKFHCISAGISVAQHWDHLPCLELPTDIVKWRVHRSE